MQQKLAELQEIVDLPRKYFEELDQAEKECDELAKDQNADSAAVAAAEKKLNDLKDKINNEKRVIIGVAWRDTSCSYNKQKQNPPPTPTKVTEGTDPNDDTQEKWGPQ